LWSSGGRGKGARERKKNAKGSVGALVGQSFGGDLQVFFVDSAYSAKVP
jgi:hypothetical protein